MNQIVDIALAYEPRRWQAELHDLMAAHRFVVAVVHRRGGKTWAACAALCMSALARPNTRYGYTAPTRTQAKSITWQVFRDMLAPIPGIDFKESDLRIVFPNGSEIGLYSGENHDSVRGIGLHGVVIDEVANLPLDAWYASLRPTLSSTGGWALFVGTPRGADLLSELYQYAANGADPDWAVASYPAWPENTTGVLSDAEIEAARRSTPSEGTFLREYGVRLDVSAEDQLVRLEDVLACQSRTTSAKITRDPALSREPRLIGVDVGGGGANGDNSVIAKRWGFVAFEPIVVGPDQHVDLPMLIANAIRDFDADACFVDATGGYASHVIPTLQNMGHVIVPVNFAGEAVDKALHANRRAAMHAQLAEWTRRPNSVLPAGQKLASDLTATRFSHDAKGRILLEPKKQVRSRLGRSPDFADALALTFAAPVMAPSNRAPISATRQDRGDRYQSDYRRRMPEPPANNVYDPFSGSYAS